MQICFCQNPGGIFAKKSQVWFLVFNAPQLPQGASHTSCRQKLRLCYFFRLRKNQTPGPWDYIEREDKIFRIHSFTCSVNPQERVKTSWDCIWRDPMATPDLQMSLLKLCCWTGERSLPVTFILEYSSAKEAWYLLSLLTMCVCGQLALHFTLLKYFGMCHCGPLLWSGFSGRHSSLPRAGVKATKECQSLLCPGPPVSWDQGQQCLPQQ